MARISSHRQSYRISSGIDCSKVRVDSRVKRCRPGRGLASTIPAFRVDTLANLSGCASFCGILRQRKHLTPIAATVLAQGRALVNRRSEEHTSELQSRSDIVCRLLLEKKKQ